MAISESKIADKDSNIRDAGLRATRTTKVKHGMMQENPHSFIGNFELCVENRKKTVLICRFVKEKLTNGPKYQEVCLAK